MEQNNIWSMIEKYYPNYYNSEDIAILNDLQKIIDGEWEHGDSAHKMFVDLYDSDKNDSRIQNDYNYYYKKILKQTIISMHRIIENGGK